MLRFRTTAKLICLLLFWQGVSLHLLLGLGSWSIKTWHQTWYQTLCRAVVSQEQSWYGVQTGFQKGSIQARSTAQVNRLLVNRLLANRLQARPKARTRTRIDGVSRIEYSIYAAQNKERHTIAQILWFQKYEAKQKKMIRKMISDLYKKSAARKYFEATLAWQNRQPKQSLKLVEQSLFLDNTLSFSWALHSVVLGELKQLPSAIESMNRAIALNPYEANYLLTKASYHARLGNLKKALKYCDRALEIRENFAAAYLMKARLLFLRKKDRLASENYLLAQEAGMSESLIHRERKKIINSAFIQN